MARIQTYDWKKTYIRPILDLCNAITEVSKSHLPLNHKKEFHVNASSSSIKFTDGIERELIQREQAGAEFGTGEDLVPLLKWLAAVTLALGSLLVITHGGHGAF